MVRCKNGHALGRQRRTPRSPRATMIASERCTIASSRSIAGRGFSSFDSTIAWSPIRARASSMSSGRCTHTTSAPSSTPIASAKRSPRASFSVSGEIGSTTPGTFTPLRSLRRPPTITARHRMVPSERVDLQLQAAVIGAVMWRRGSRAAKISGCGRFTRRASPSAGFAGPAGTVPRAASSTGAAGEAPDPQLGPLQVRQYPDRAPEFRARSARAISQRARCSSAVPWLKLSRNTSTPVSNSCG